MATVSAAPVVVDRLVDAELERSELIVELVQRPSGVDSVAFARQLVEAEALIPWNGDHEGNSAHGLGVISRLAGDGRNVVVYFQPSEGREVAGRACRIRARTPLQSDSRWQAYRWCHSAFGLQTPQTRPPPIIGITSVR